MKLTTFLTRCQKHEQLPPVLYFTGRDYPVLTCFHILSFLRKHNYQIKTTLLDSMEWSQVEMSLHTTFLGQSHFVWLGDLTTLDARNSKKVLTALSEYSGPHKVICFIGSTQASFLSESNIVESDQEFSKEDIEKIFQFFFDTSAEPLFKMLKQEYRSLSLDKILLIGYYSTLVGSSSELFMQSWYEKLVAPEESLFTLAQSFFGRKKDLFFRSWNSLKDSYEGPFWTTFWSDQLWAASHVVSLRKAQKYHEAKQMSGRLPFAFLQKDWEKYTAAELQHAHAFLYAVDCHIKNGGSELTLELFYTKFFEKKFAQQI